MITVAGTSPLRYLILVEAVDVLPRIFGQVHAPPEVMQALGASRSPELEAVRRWAASPAAWLTVQGSRELDPSIQLGTGECPQRYTHVFPAPDPHWPGHQIKAVLEAADPSASMSFLANHQDPNHCQSAGFQRRQDLP